MSIHFGSVGLTECKKVKIALMGISCSTLWCYVIYEVKCFAHQKITTCCSRKISLWCRWSVVQVLISIRHTLYSRPTSSNRGNYLQTTNCYIWMVCNTSLTIFEPLFKTRSIEKHLSKWTMFVVHSINLNKNVIQCDFYFRIIWVILAQIQLYSASFVGRKFREERYVTRCIKVWTCEEGDWAIKTNLACTKAENVEDKVRLWVFRLWCGKFIYRGLDYIKAQVT